jgi:hypothetical protein
MRVSSSPASFYPPKSVSIWRLCFGKNDFYNIEDELLSIQGTLSESRLDLFAIRKHVVGHARQMIAQVMNRSSGELPFQRRVIFDDVETASPLPMQRMEDRSVHANPSRPYSSPPSIERGARSEANDHRSFSE